MLVADIYEPHPYKAAGTKKHAPCKDCGSAQGAFVHSQEAAKTGYRLTHVHAPDSGSGTDKT